MVDANFEITTTKNESRLCVVVYILIIVLCLSIAGKFIHSSFCFLGTKNDASFLSLLTDVLIIVTSLATARVLLTDLMFAIRFYRLSLRISNDTLLLYTHKKKCKIPLDKDVNTMRCMSGWLILWSSGDTNKALLIRNTLLEPRYLQMESYWESKTNFLSSSDEKRKALKSFHINILNPLKYVKWPNDTP